MMTRASQNRIYIYTVHRVWPCKSVIFLPKITYIYTVYIWFWLTPMMTDNRHPCLVLQLMIDNRHLLSWVAAKSLKWAHCNRYAAGPGTTHRKRFATGIATTHCKRCAICGKPRHNPPQEICDRHSYNPPQEMCDMRQAQAQPTARDLRQAQLQPQSCNVPNGMFTN
jgi:hypothetical protein